MFKVSVIQLVYALVEFLAGETTAELVLGGVHADTDPAMSDFRLYSSKFFMTYRGTEVQNVGHLISLAEEGMIDLTGIRLYDQGIPLYAVTRQSPYAPDEDRVIVFVAREHLLEEYETEAYSVTTHFGNGSNLLNYAGGTITGYGLNR